MVNVSEKRQHEGDKRKEELGGDVAVDDLVQQLLEDVAKNENDAENRDADGGRDKNSKADVAVDNLHESRVT